MSSTEEQVSGHLAALRALRQIAEGTYAYPTDPVQVARCALRVIDTMQGGARPLNPFTLEVGLSADEREVVVNHLLVEPLQALDGFYQQILTNIEQNASGGHLIFSPQQAIDFAVLLVRKAMECER